MPTFEASERFHHEYSHLTASQRQQFKKGLQEFIQILASWEREQRRGIPQFPKKLGVKPMVAQRSILEFAWRRDGRCTWEYGTPRRSGKFHIVLE